MFDSRRFGDRGPNERLLLISWLSVEFVDAAGISKVSKFTMVLVNVILRNYVID